MNSSEYFDECLLCGSKKMKPLRNYEKNYLTQCSSCGFVFSARKPTTEELKNYYGGYPRAQSISNITLSRYEILLNQFEPYRKNNNLIDVGCGDGYFLASAKNRGWNVYGTEFTKQAVEVCEQKGITMKEGALDAKDYQPDFFDVITSFEVIEHINNPMQEIDSFRTILRNGGLVYVTTPNFDSASRYFLAENWNVIQYPEHLSYYTKKTLTNLFASKNFRLKEITTTGISIDRFRASHQPNKEVQVSPLDEKIRQNAENKWALQFLKKTVNAALDLSNKGDAIKAMYEKIN